MFLHLRFLQLIFFWNMVMFQEAHPISRLIRDSADIGEPESDIVDIISSKSYMPKENMLPEVSIIKNEGNDVTYLLSKLSDEDLVKLLNDQSPKDEYDLTDIAKLIAGFGNKSENKHSPAINIDSTSEKVKSKKLDYSGNENIEMPFFRLDNKKIKLNSKSKSKYSALKKLKNLLNFRPQVIENDSLDDEKKELLFNVLVNQLKTLCCKKSNKSDRHIVNSNMNSENLQSNKVNGSSEYMFLIMNEEIKTNGEEELILVNPKSLKQNSSVLLLGPITTPLSDSQVKLIINRISKELSKPEYVTLLQELAEGTINDSNIDIMQHFISGPDTRRYIKPHRCNHQSKLARVYGGPKWLICTGYINLNTPSLYD